MLSKTAFMNTISSHDNNLDPNDTFIYYSVFNKTDPIVGCPPGSTVYGDKDAKKCSQCINGKTNNFLDNNDCYDCSPNYQKIYYQGNDSLECNECPIGSVYIRSNYSNKLKECSQTKCLQHQYFDLETMKCLDCKELIPDSIGRPVGTPPLYKYCSCRNNYLRIRYDSTTTKCFSDANFRDYADDNIPNTYNNNGYYFIQKDSYHYFTFMDCHPHQRPSYIDHYCICNKGFLYNNGRCQPYIDENINSNGIDQIKSVINKNNIQSISTNLYLADCKDIANTYDKTKYVFKNCSDGTKSTIQQDRP
ncbi:MAG: hypothetical protein MHPSP_001102, partial [Paramarteilia canceri]